ncbi:hypothetical protein CCR75_009229 [Bremia lactucae]|uniref:Secreted RxLR effector n=1 Tax=Bremia lactucae TaxID=4779 RepID=A0A976IFA6_BRELC|nr:hypothetical protein CCR75_009229 [Bremia lactucae]
MLLKYFVAILAVQHSAGAALDPNEQKLIEPIRRRLEPLLSFPANQLVDESHGALRTSRGLAQDDDNETRMISTAAMKPPIIKSLANSQTGGMRNAVSKIVAEKANQVEHFLADKDTVAAIAAKGAKDLPDAEISSTARTSRIAERSSDAKASSSVTETSDAVNAKPVVLLLDEVEKKKLTTTYGTDFAEVLASHLPAAKKLMEKSERYAFEYKVYLDLIDHVPHKQFIVKSLDDYDPEEIYGFLPHFASMDMRNELAWSNAVLKAKDKPVLFNPIEAFKNVASIDGETKINGIVRKLRFLVLAKNKHALTNPLVKHVLNNVLRDFEMDTNSLRVILQSFPDFNELLKDFNSLFKKEAKAANAKLKKATGISRNGVFHILNAQETYLPLRIPPPKFLKYTVTHGSIFSRKTKFVSVCVYVLLKKSGLRDEHKRSNRRQEIEKYMLHAGDDVASDAHACFFSYRHYVRSNTKLYVCMRAQHREKVTSCSDGAMAPVAQQRGFIQVVG